MIKQQVLTRAILLYIFCIFFSCSTKTMFDKQELSWVNTYQINDELVFKSLKTSKEITILITKKKIYHKEYNPIESELVAHSAELSYKIKNKNYNAKLIEMYKNEKELATPTISFLGSTFLVEENQLKFSDVNLNIAGRSFKEVYTFYKKKGKHYSDARHKSQPQTLYWD